MFYEEVFKSYVPISRVAMGLSFEESGATNQCRLHINNAIGH